MKTDGRNTLIFSDGTGVYASMAVVGLDVLNGLSIYNGYDGKYVDDDPDEVEFLTLDQRIELESHMIQRWAEVHRELVQRRRNS